jgi:hypothetical protein
MKRFTPLSFLSSIRIADSNTKMFAKDWLPFWPWPHCLR